MEIKFNEDNKVFHLKNRMISYVFSIEENKYLSHHYWGKALKEINNSTDYPRIDRSFAPNPEETNDRNFSLAVIPQEFPGKDIGDFREPAYAYADNKGWESNRLEFKDFTIEKGKKKLDKLPHVYLNKENEAMTLSINLYDKINNIDVILYYTIFKDLPVITRHVKFINNGDKPITLKRVLSMSVDFIDNEFELIQLPGAWSRERELVRNPIYRGIHKIDSKHGTTSHTYQPFIGLVREDTKEDYGEVYGMQLVYSGEFIANVEVDPYDQTRVQMGINPYHFEWELNKDESFETPEVVMVYSDKGLNDMSQTFHNLYQNNLIRGKHKYKKRPILINNWEATYFDFNEEKLLKIAQESKDLGIELFVLDDGWFGNRNDDKSSLGDWIVDKNKLPNGLKQFRNAIDDMGMKFGLWFEPEMVSEDSELYRNHPDWCIHVPNRPKSRGRSQLVLDFSRKEVRNYILKQMKDILDDVPLDYIKWDYNRNMSEIGSSAVSSKQGEVSHKYILGLYEVMEELVTSYPNILFESCSGGGGRYDPGMLYYMPQTWTSDNTDAVSRLKIQYGTSLTMPISSMGAHVSDIPNHQVNRSTNIEMRGHVASSGNLGYELDVTKLSLQEKETIKEQIAFYKRNKEIIQYGNFYRIKSPFDSYYETSWIFVDDEKNNAIFYFFQILDKPNGSLSKLKMTGLDPNKNYIFDNGKVYGGDELMYRGIILDPSLSGDYQGLRIVLKAIE